MGGNVVTTVTTVCTTEPSASVVEEASTTVVGGRVLSTRTDVVIGIYEEGSCGCADDCEADELSSSLAHEANKV